AGQRERFSAYRISPEEHIASYCFIEARDMDLSQIRHSIEQRWRSSIVQQLQAYVRIPNKSPMFDADWERNGYMDAAANLIADWCRAQPVPGMRVEVHRLPGLTPIVL